MEKKGENGTTRNMQMSSKDYKEDRRFSIPKKKKTAKLSIPYCDEKQEEKMNLYLSPTYIEKATSRDKIVVCS